MKPFQFKQFSVAHDKCAMKIGTDAVLLGAWVECENVNSILDIGTGTGVIALQLAQRTNAELIDAVEIEDNAYEQAVENFEQSIWGDRLFCYHASLQEFVEEMDEQYDLIVSNPPFYTSTFKEGIISENRSKARHIKFLTFEKLLEATSTLLCKTGSCAFIIPYNQEFEFIEIAKKHKLLLNRKTHIKGTIETKVKRSLLQFSFTQKEVIFDELIIETQRHQYTNKYKNLVKDFYLKM